MKAPFKQLTLLVASFYIPLAAFASAGWTDYAPVIELTPTTQGRFLVQLKVSENPSGCRNTETFYRDYGYPGSEKMYLALLEATTAGKKVRVHVTGVCDLNGYSEISSVGISP